MFLGNTKPPLPLCADDLVSKCGYVCTNFAHVFSFTGDVGNTGTIYGWVLPGPHIEFVPFARASVPSAPRTRGSTALRGGDGPCICSILQ